MEDLLERIQASIAPHRQLSQRSNQFKSDDAPLWRAACEAMMTDPSSRRSRSARRQIGDYGLISVVILKKAGSDIEIDEVSDELPVLQRGVESFTLNTSFPYAAQQGAKRVTGHYLPTKKNDMVNGFSRASASRIGGRDGGASKWASRSAPISRARHS